MIGEIKVGQVITFRGKKILNRIIQIGMGHYYSHAAWIVGMDGSKILIQEAKGLTNRVSTNVYERSWILQQLDDNQIKIMDFKIRPNENFHQFVKEQEGKKYDYLTNLIHIWTRIRRLLGKSKVEIPYDTKDTVNCSEMIARGIAHTTGINVLDVLNKKYYDQVTPQGLSNLHDRMQQGGLL